MVLNNNYHAVHHDLPGVPWFALRNVYRARRNDYLARNGGFVVRGYVEWLRRHALCPVAHVVRPFADTPATQRAVDCAVDLRAVASASPGANADAIRITG